MRLAPLTLVAVAVATTLTFGEDAAAQVRSCQHLGKTIFCPPGVTTGSTSTTFTPGGGTTFSNGVTVPTQVFTPFDRQHIQALTVNLPLTGSPTDPTGTDRERVGLFLLQQNLSGAQVRDILGTDDKPKKINVYPNGTVQFTYTGNWNRSITETYLPDGTHIVQTTETVQVEGGPDELVYQDVTVTNPDGSSTSEVLYQSPSGPQTTVTQTTINPDGSKTTTGVTTDVVNDVSRTSTYTSTSNPDGTRTSTSADYDDKGNLTQGNTTNTQGTPPNASGTITFYGPDGQPQTTVTFNQSTGQNDRTTYSADGSTSTQSYTKDGEPKGDPVKTPPSGGSGPPPPALPPGISATAPTPPPPVTPPAPPTGTATGTNGPTVVTFDPLAKIAKNEATIADPKTSQTDKDRLKAQNDELRKYINVAPAEAKAAPAPRAR